MREYIAVKRFFRSEKSVKLFATLFVILILTLGVVSAREIKKMNTKYSFSEFFPRAHPLLLESQKVRFSFQLEESSPLLLVLRTNNKNWLDLGKSKEGLKQLRSLTEGLRQLKGVKTTYSMATLEGAMENQGQILVGPVLDNILPKDRQAFVSNSPLLLGQLISKDLRSVLIVIEPAMLSPQELSLLRRQLLSEVKKKLPEVQVELGGGPEVQRQFTEKLSHELILLLSLSLLCFCLVFFVLIKGWRSLFLAFGTLMTSNLFVLCLISYSQIPFSILLSTLPIILSVAVISVVLHTLHRWAEIRHEKNLSLASPLSLRISAAWQVGREMLLPNFLGSLTTSLGFVALCSADIPLIRQYGWVVALSVAITWIMAQMFLFVFMPFVDAELRPWALKKALWALVMLKKSGPIVAATLGTCLIIGSQGYKVNFSGRLFDDLSKTDSARMITEKIDRQFGGIVPYDLELVQPLQGAWKEPQQLVKLQSALIHIRKMEGVGSALAVTDLLEPKSSERRPAQTGFLSSGSLSSKAKLTETLFLYSMAEQNPIRNYLNEQADSLRIAIRFHDLPGSKTQALQDRIKSLLMKEFSQIEIREAGIGYLTHTLNAEVSKELVFGFWQSLVLIGTLLIFIFRSLRWALIACLPNLIPPVVLFGLMGVTQVAVKPGVAIIFSIALGLAFNNTVYLLTRLQALMKAKPGKVTAYLPLRQTLLQEGYPCLFETLIMICGFSIFLFSGFKINQIFGIYMLISIFAGAIGDLVFLPSLLKLWPRLLLKVREMKE
ncbi:MAG: efflux RND transporter permease subunit [Pseudobdellovibrionaceae bacterium]